MENKTTDTKPTLTNEQKLKIAIAHREWIKADTEVKLAERKRQEVLDYLSRTVDQIGIELNLEKGKYTVDLDALDLRENEAKK